MTNLQCVSFYAPNVCKNGLRSNCTYDLRMTLSTTIAVWLDYCVGDFLVVLESPFLHDEIYDVKHQLKCADVVFEKIFHYVFITSNHRQAVFSCFLGRWRHETCWFTDIDVYSCLKGSIKHVIIK